MGIEMYRIDGGVVIVPRDEQRGRLHCEHGSSMGSPETDRRRSTRKQEGERGAGSQGVSLREKKGEWESCRLRLRSRSRVERRGCRKKRWRNAEESSPGAVGQARPTRLDGERITARGSVWEETRQGGEKAKLLIGIWPFFLSLISSRRCFSLRLGRANERQRDRQQSMAPLRSRRWLEMGFHCSTGVWLYGP